MDPYFLIILFAVVGFCVILLLKVYCVKIYRRYTNSARSGRNTRIPQTHTDHHQTTFQDQNNSHNLLSRAYNSDSCNTPMVMPFPSTRARPMQQISANNPYPPPFSHTTSTNSALNNVQTPYDSEFPPSYEVATGQYTSTSR